MTCLAFSASKLAATAIWTYFGNPAISSRVSGYQASELQDCFDWMSAFAITIKEMGPAAMKHFENIPQDDLHNIQTHSVDLSALVSIPIFNLIYLILL